MLVCVLNEPNARAPERFQPPSCSAATGASVMFSGCTTSLSDLTLPERVKDQLDQADFKEVGDLDGLTATELAHDLDITTDSAAEIMLWVRSACDAGSALVLIQSGLDKLKEERNTRRVTTFGRELDALLDGGVQLKKLTEFSGVPGVGKTQMAMQLALTVQIPEAFGGLEGEAVYIDTEGSFFAPRANQMAEALIARLHEQAVASPARQAALDALDARGLLSRISFFRVHSAMELLAVVKSLEALVVSQQRVRLIIIDSIAFPLRHLDVTMTRRLRMLGQMVHSLSTLAMRHGIAVVLINQVTTKVNDVMGTSSLVVREQDWHPCPSVPSEAASVTEGGSVLLSIAFHPSGA